MGFKSQIMRQIQTSTTLSLTVTLSVVEVFANVQVFDINFFLSRNRFHFNPNKK
jgi:hypothetical protein